MKLCCPASWRPYDAYAVSSNGVFELARLERDFKCSFLGFNRPELKVYSTQYKYQEINDHFSEQYMGKIIQNFGLFSRKLSVFENQNGLNLKYEIVGSCGSRLKNCICPKLPCCCLKSTKFRIIDKIKPEADFDE